MWGWSQPITSPQRDERYPYSDIHHCIGPWETNKRRKNWGTRRQQWLMMCQGQCDQPIIAQKGQHDTETCRLNPAWAKMNCCQDFIYTQLFPCLDPRRAKMESPSCLKSRICRKPMPEAPQPRKGWNTSTCIHACNSQVCFCDFIVPTEILLSQLARRGPNISYVEQAPVSTPWQPSPQSHSPERDNDSFCFLRNGTSCADKVALPELLLLETFGRSFPRFKSPLSLH